MRLLTIPHALYAAAVVAIGLAMLGCGTVVYKHTVEVLISDPAHRLGSPPYDVSVFDYRMGSTSDWARKWMGPTSDAAPYRVEYSSTSVATIFDPPRPDKFELAVAVPSLETRGFFTLSVHPQPNRSRRQPAGFVAYMDNFMGQAPTLTVEHTATPAPHGWHLVIRLVVPPAP